jgi:hypothetical protein
MSFSGPQGTERSAGGSSAGNGVSASLSGVVGAKQAFKRFLTRSKDKDPASLTSAYATLHGGGAAASSAAAEDGDDVLPASGSSGGKFGGLSAGLASASKASKSARALVHTSPEFQSQRLRLKVARDATHELDKECEVFVRATADYASAVKRFHGAVMKTCGGREADVIKALVAAGVLPPAAPAASAAGPASVSADAEAEGSVFPVALPSFPDLSQADAKARLDALLQPLMYAVAPPATSPGTLPGSAAGLAGGASVTPGSPPGSVSASFPSLLHFLEKTLPSLVNRRLRVLLRGPVTSAIDAARNAKQSAYEALAERNALAEKVESGLHGASTVSAMQTRAALPQAAARAVQVESECVRLMSAAEGAVSGALASWLAIGLPAQGKPVGSGDAGAIDSMPLGGVAMATSASASASQQQPSSGVANAIAGRVGGRPASFSAPSPLGGPAAAGGGTAMTAAATTTAAPEAAGAASVAPSRDASPSMALVLHAIAAAAPAAAPTGPRYWNGTPPSLTYSGPNPEPTPFPPLLNGEVLLALVPRTSLYLAAGTGSLGRGVLVCTIYRLRWFSIGLLQRWNQWQGLRRSASVLDLSSELREPVEVSNLAEAADAVADEERLLAALDIHAVIDPSLPVPGPVGLTAPAANSAGSASASPSSSGATKSRMDRVAGLSSPKPLSPPLPPPSFPAAVSPPLPSALATPLKAAAPPRYTPASPPAVPGTPGAMSSPLSLGAGATVGLGTSRSRGPSTLDGIAAASEFGAADAPWPARYGAPLIISIPLLSISRMEALDLPSDSAIPVGPGSAGLGGDRGGAGAAASSSASGVLSCLVVQCTDLRVASFVFPAAGSSSAAAGIAAGAASPFALEASSVERVIAPHTWTKSPAFPLSHKANLPPWQGGIDGWRIFSLRSELTRQIAQTPSVAEKSKASTSAAKLAELGAMKLWRITHANASYTLSPTYPRASIVPSSVSDGLICGGAKFRSKHRFPAISWTYSEPSGTGTPTMLRPVCLSRASQPMVGILGAKSSEDEQFLASMRAFPMLVSQGRGPNEVTLASSPAVRASNDVLLLIADARPKKNALGNQAMGGGSETLNNYPSCALEFLGIDNIHVVRKAFILLHAAVLRESAKKGARRAVAAAQDHNRGIASNKVSFSSTANGTSTPGGRGLGGIARSPSLAGGSMMYARPSMSETPRGSMFDAASTRRGAPGGTEVLLDEAARTAAALRAIDEAVEAAVASGAGLMCDDGTIAEDGTLISRRPSDADDDASSVVSDRSDKGENIESTAAASSLAGASGAATPKEKDAKPSKLFGRLLKSAVASASGSGGSGFRRLFKNGNKTLADDSGNGALDNSSPDVTPWLRLLSVLMTGAVKVTSKLLNRVSVFVHCSDGWDRTAALTSLAQIMVDPYYRTLAGMCVLIEKEWCSFGHRFGRRCGTGGVGVDRVTAGDEQRSPIFVQWVDCLWQIYRQFPRSFEFNERLLFALVDHVYSGRFGTFILDNEKMRVNASVAQTSESMWTQVLHPATRSCFLNTRYEPVEPQYTSDAVIAWLQECQTQIDGMDAREECMMELVKATRCPFNLKLGDHAIVPSVALQDIALWPFWSVRWTGESQVELAAGPLPSPRA